MEITDPNEERAEVAVASELRDRLGAKREVINFLAFFSLVLNGGIKLSNTQDATVIASWKVGGQDFYIYGRRA